MLWLLEELGVEYELKLHKRHPETIRAPAELREVHPLGKAPVVVVDGEAIAESGAIIEYCVETLGDGALAPGRGEPGLREYRYWMHYAEGSMMSPLLVRLIFDKVKSAPLPFFIKPIARGIVKKVETNYTKPEIARHQKFVNDHLAGREYFAGESFSAADIQMSYPVEAALARGRASVATENMQAWVDRMRARPAYERAVERGGPNVMPG